MKAIETHKEYKQALTDNSVTISTTKVDGMYTHIASFLPIFKDGKSIQPLKLTTKETVFSARKFGYEYFKD